MLLLLLSLIILLCTYVSSLNETTISLSIPLLHGIEIPRLGIGTAALAGNSKEIVSLALEIGYRLIDTAQANEWYDEKGVGLGINEFLYNNKKNNLRSNNIDRSDIIIVTKVHPRSYEYNQMHLKIVDSMKLLYGKDIRPIDVVLLHSPYCWQGQCTKQEEQTTWLTAWSNLEQIKSTGIISNIGVSNFHYELLYQLITISTTRISVIQNWMDPFHQDKEVRKLAKENGIAYMAYSSFGTQWEYKYNGENPVFNSIELQQIAAKHKKSISQVVLSWLLQEDVVAIPRSTSIDHLRENYDLIAKDENNNPIGINAFLDDDDMYTISQLDGSIGDLWSD